MTRADVFQITGFILAFVGLSCVSLAMAFGVAGVVLFVAGGLAARTGGPR